MVRGRATVSDVDRRLISGALVVATVTLAALGGCSRGTVRIDAQPSVGDEARYRYVIDASITRALDGSEPSTTEVSSTLLADQKVVTVGDTGIEADITLRRDGAAPRTARVVLDRTGAIRSIELVAGLDTGELGLAQLDSLLPRSVAPPERPLAPGDRWSVSEGSLEGHGRLTRLGVVDGEDVAVVRTSVTEEVDDVFSSGTTQATLRGQLRSVSTATYDLADGSARRSVARSRGTVQATILPPPWIDAEPVLGTISYDIRVQATRLT